MIEYKSKITNPVSGHVFSGHDLQISAVNKYEETLKLGNISDLSFVIQKEYSTISFNTMEYMRNPTFGWTEFTSLILKVVTKYGAVKEYTFTNLKKGKITGGFDSSDAGAKMNYIYQFDHLLIEDIQ